MMLTSWCEQSGKEQRHGASEQEKRHVGKEVALRYLHARKKEKGIMLQEFCATTGYTPPYAAYLLRSLARRMTCSPYPPRLSCACFRRVPCRSRRPCREAQVSHSHSAHCMWLPKVEPWSWHCTTPLTRSGIVLL
jgi:hypothetical protein